MSMTEPGRTMSQTDVRGPATDSFRRTARETKPSFMTTEFWAMVIGVVAIVAVYNVTDDASLTLFRTSILATVLAVGYMISRGLAKCGSGDGRIVRDY